MSLVAQRSEGTSVLSDLQSGITGYNHRGVVQYCYATGTITGTNTVSGIAGYKQGTVDHCVALNKEVSATDASGDVGRVGYNDGGTLSNNFARAAGMVLKQGGTTISPTAATLTGKDGADIAAAYTHGENCVEFWSAGCDTDLWDLEANRLPWLRTTEGKAFSEAQNPTV